MKKRLMLVVSLLCIASLMAAMAYSTAKVTNAADLSVVNTTDALLQLHVNDIHNVGLQDGAAYIDNGNLMFDFDKGLGNAQFGLQKNSEYTWFNDVAGHYYGLFWVWNKSNEDLVLNLKATGVPTGVDIYARRCHSGGVYSEGWQLISDSDGYSSNYWNENANNNFGIKIVVSDTAVIANTENMKIEVTGTAVFDGSDTQTN